MYGINVHAKQLFYETGSLLKNECSALNSQQFFSDYNEL